MAIRNAKLTRLCIGFPHIQPADHALRLTRDFVMEGWLHKTGPDVKDAWRRRWFTLDRRRLYYFDEPMVSVTVIPQQKQKSYVAFRCSDDKFSKTKSA